MASRKRPFGENGKWFFEYNGNKYGPFKTESLAHQIHDQHCKVMAALLRLDAFCAD